MPAEPKLDECNSDHFKFGGMSASRENQALDSIHYCYIVRFYYKPNLFVVIIATTTSLFTKNSASFSSLYLPTGLSYVSQEIRQMLLTFV